MQIFISHVDQDRQLAIDLASQLIQAGLSVWNPYEELFPGGNWEKETGKALEESQIMVVLLTRAAQGSETLRRQIQFALTSGNYGGRVIPVAVDMPVYESGKDIAWVLVHLDPEHVDPAIEGWDKVVKRVQVVAEKSYHAAK